MNNISIENNLILQIVVVFILVFGCSTRVHATSSVEGILTASISVEALTTLTNKERLKNHLLALEQSDLLQTAAELKVNDMIKRGYFSHNTPEGERPWYWLEKAGYDYEVAGENLAIKFFESSKAVNAWMNSPKHRQNILDEEYTQVGIAVAEGEYNGKETVFVVQLFGTPKEKISFFHRIGSEFKSIFVLWSYLV